MDICLFSPFSVLKYTQGRFSWNVPFLWLRRASSLFLLSLLALCCNVDFSCTRPDLKIEYRRKTRKTAVKDDFLQQTPLKSHSSSLFSFSRISWNLTVCCSGRSTPGFVPGPLKPSSVDWDSLHGGALGVSSQRLRPSLWIIIPSDRRGTRPPLICAPLICVPALPLSHI